MEFSSVASSVHALYREGRFQDALALVDVAKRSLPEQDGRLTFWEACLLARSGDPHGAVEVLADGTRRGLWWPQGMLTDSDLDPVRHLPGWQEVVSACENQEEIRLAARPRPRVREGSGAGTLLALHGAHANPVEFARQWETALTEEWTVVTPVGDVPVPEGGWSWAHDRATRARAAMAQVGNVATDTPLVLTGFSAGATLGVELAATEVHPDCLILIAPFLDDSDDFRTALEALRAPVLLVYGTEDHDAPRYQELEGVVSDALACDGVGHALPPGLDAVVERAASLIESRPQDPGDAG